MANKDLMELELDITRPKATARELTELRTLLLIEINQTDVDSIEIGQPPEPRSPDAVVIGAIVVGLLPVVADKLGDLLIDWLKRHDECNITLKVPLRNAAPLEITYDPRYTSEHDLKAWIDQARKLAKDAGEK